MYIPKLGSGRALVTSVLAKAYPETIVVVPDLGSLDVLVRLGIQPSQIRLGSELRSSGSIDYLSIDGVEVNVDDAK